MKIKKPTPDDYAKISALLRQSFPGSNKEVVLIENMHTHNRELHEWVCIHVNRVIAYICFSTAYKGHEACGLHLGPLAVKPDFQRQGIGTELLRFALRQKIIQENKLFVLGNPLYYKKFGFEPCSSPRCPFDTNNAHFLAIRNSTASTFTVGYESEFGA